ncbi:hypothetical protein AB1N83_011985 [Pleurotus pulmonarius]
MAQEMCRIPREHKSELYQTLHDKRNGDGGWDAKTRAGKRVPPERAMRERQGRREPFVPHVTLIEIQIFTT